MSTRPREQARDLRYYVDMVLCCQLLQKAKPGPEDIAGLLPMCIAASITDKQLAEAAQEAFDRFDDLGGTDKVAKGPDLTKRLLEYLSDKYPSRSMAAKTGKDAASA